MYMRFTERYSIQPPLPLLLFLPSFKLPACPLFIPPSNAFLKMVVVVVVVVVAAVVVVAVVVVVVLWCCGAVVPLLVVMARSTLGERVL